MKYEDWLNLKSSVSPEKEENTSNYELFQKQLQSKHVSLDVIYDFVCQHVLGEKDKNDMLGKLCAICAHIEQSAKNAVICEKDGEEVKCENDNKEDNVKTEEKKDCAVNEGEVKQKEFIKPSDIKQVKAKLVKETPKKKEIHKTAIESLVKKDEKQKPIKESPKKGEAGFKDKISPVKKDDKQKLVKESPKKEDKPKSIKESLKKTEKAKVAKNMTFTKKKKFIKCA